MPNGGVVTMETCHITLDTDAAARIATARPGEYSADRQRHGTRHDPRSTQARNRAILYDQRTRFGAGLATVYGAVQHSGGVVAIQSALTKGTDVHLYFPKVPSRRFSCRAQETAGILVDDPFMSLDPRTRCDAAFCDPARPTSQRTPQASARAWFVRWFDTSMACLHRSARASLRRVSGLVAEIAGDLLPRHIEGLPHNLERFRSIGGVLNQRIGDAAALD